MPFPDVFAAGDVPLDPLAGVVVVAAGLLAAGWLAGAVAVTVFVGEAAGALPCPAQAAKPAEFPFAGLHQLSRPCLGLLDRLPEPQAAALRGAFGLTFDPVHSRFLVWLGLLSLLAELSEQAPVLCLIDDAHWCARRFTVRPPAPSAGPPTRRWPRRRRGAPRFHGRLPVRGDRRDQR